MGGLLHQILRQHHEEKMQQSGAELGSDLYLVQKGIAGDAPDEIWKPALERLTKHPALKDHKDAITGAVSRLTQPQPPPVKVPTATPPGQTPGTATAEQPTPLGDLNPRQLGIFNSLSDRGQNEYYNRAQGGAPAPPPTAQPATNPLQDVGPITPPPAEPQAPPVAAAQPPAPRNPLIPQSPDEMLQSVYGTGYLNPAQRRMREGMMGPTVQRNEQLRLENTEVARKSQALKDLQASPDWEKIPDFLKSQWKMWAAVPGSQMPSMARSMLRPVQSSAIIPGEDLGGETDVAGNPTVKGQYYKALLDPISGQPMGYIHHAVTSGTATDAGGNVVARDRYAAPGTKVGVSPGQLTFKTFTGPGGGQFINNAYGLTHGQSNTPVPGAVNPALLPTTSVSQTPGEAPTTTVRTKGGRGGAAIPAVSGEGSASTTAPSPTAGVVDPVVKREYDDWVNGGPAPTGKKLSAVQKYAEDNKLPTPTTLTAQGGKDLKAVDDVLSQIKSIKDKMKQRGMHEKDDLSYYPDYLKYAHGGKSTPNQDIWTGLSFERLRSAAAALSGTNSRALPIMHEALAHTPNPSASMTSLPETPKKMYNKLTEMEDILSKGRAAILKDQRKSGVVQESPGEGGGDKVEQLLKKHGFSK